MDTTYFEPREQLIRLPVAPMHHAPDAHTEQVSQALLAERVVVVDEREGWAQICTPDGYQGWVEEEALCAAPEGWGAPWAEVTDLWVNLRVRPDYRLASALQAPIGVRLPLVGEQEKWVQLLAPDGRRLWTEAQRVQTVGEAPLRSSDPREIGRTARRFLGVPYLWGGKSPAGLDCSGLVQTVLGLHGVALRRDACQQAEDGEPCEAAEAADLVFFATGSDPQRISHVGMMLDRRRFIHAAGGDRVRINRLEEEPFAGQLRCVRRFIPR